MNQHEAAHLWTLLAQTWGTKFLEQYGAKPNEAWTAALAHVSPEMARQALWALIAEGSAFPPTLPEFVAAARKASADQAIQRRNAMALAPPAGEPSPNAQANLDKLRALLRS